jgi:DNA integrity scanning protein DisA with diadenylate cyclase activity
LQALHLFLEITFLGVGELTCNGLERYIATTLYLKRNKMQFSHKLNKMTNASDLCSWADAIYKAYIRPGVISKVQMSNIQQQKKKVQMSKVGFILLFHSANSVRNLQNKAPLSFLLHLFFLFTPKIQKILEENFRVFVRQTYFHKSYQLYTVKEFSQFTIIKERKLVLKGKLKARWHLCTA